VISSQGTQQGDPAGPFLFCLGLKAVLAKLQRELQGPCAILGLMDDVTVLLPSDQAEEAWNKAKACFQEYGLTLRADKSKLLPLDARGLNGHDQFPGRQTLIAASAEKPSGEVEIARAGAKLVGVPYGSELYIETYLLLQWLAKTQELLTEIAKMGSVQDQLLLLRACAHPHVAYWNRLLPPDYPFKDLFLAQHDNIVLGTLPVYCAWSGQAKPNRPAAYADWVAPSPRGHGFDPTTLPDKGGTLLVGR